MVRERLAAKSMSKRIARASVRENSSQKISCWQAESMHV